ncbi:MAG TPA: alpha-amylase family glycosyl hydrolase, partial [Cytophagales bacterium]|nr:alpha-amylase family glycosyl hydrolase [Cytophagales bacterium]
MKENLTMIQFFHWYYPADGSLWKHFKSESKKIAELGINMAWLPPATKTDQGANGVGYQPYDLFDLGEFDQKGSVRTKYGTKDELVAAVKEALSHGIIPLADAVLNHKAGADEPEPVMACKVNPDNRTEEICE